eukprot:602279-Heterocapsa_arctica.AAC.1
MSPPAGVEAAVDAVADAPSCSQAAAQASGDCAELAQEHARLVGSGPTAHNNPTARLIGLGP